MRLDRRSFLASGAAVAAARSTAASAAEGSPIAADWSSLASHYSVPEWFRDAKFGIWAHWGPQCQPAFGDWYARLMYIQGRQPWQTGETPYEHHLMHYGHPSRSGFIDVIGQWKAEAWQPDDLLRRYKAAGAKYVMAMGCHHDNLDLYASRHHAWNSTRVGPKRDIVGTWAPLVRDAGLRFGVSNHSGHAWHWYQVAYGYDAEGPMRGRRYDAYWLRKHQGRGKYWEGLDPQELYTGPYYVPPDGIASAAAMNDWHDKRDGQWLEGAPAGTFVEKWLLRQKQIVEDYRPDIMYLDHAGVPFGAVGLEAIAHYYNQAIRWHGSPDVVVTSGTLGPFEERALVSNVERGFLADIHPRPWQTATCIGQWHYSQPVYEQNAYKSPRAVLQRLVDVVSKNGNLLLNIPIRGDGTIDDKEEAILDAIAAWMAVNGDAIHGTRPWRTFGEGPTKPPSGAMPEDQMKPFTAQDVRFTSGAKSLHAFFMEPPAKEVRIAALGGRSLPDTAIESVTFQDGRTLAFRREPEALVVAMPRTASLVPRITLRGHGLI